MVYLEFSDDRDREILEKLKELAKINRRSVEQQIMWILGGGENGKQGAGHCS